ncbi:IclR family transcriptional regulator [Rhodococcus sp. LB1]|uniref:IclR family transcriptional regulator n=1 Tax=Rhodococcus sp. LB1 TaxID=1807499 RepID=UPI00077ADB28|nr:IclR family transcriptional regulator [Rhodococcus sp. LB1]KXX55992.1 IclR family transcriptional regulator [Rhodococcus sp. LB1]
MMHVADDKHDVGSAESAPPSILAKAFLVIGAFNEQDRVLTLTQISCKTGLPKSTVHRLLQRLGELDVIEEHGAGYRLGIRLLQLVSSMPVDGMREVALPHLARLQAWSKESVHFGVLRGNEVVILQALFAVDHARPIGEVGTRIPAHLSSMGRVMMAYLPEDELTELLAGPLSRLTPKSVTDPKQIHDELKRIRVSGAAVQKDGVILGLGNIAAPVLIKGRPMGAVAVQFDSSEQVSESVINAVKLTAHRISRDTTQMLSQGRADLFPFDD